MKRSRVFVTVSLHKKEVSAGRQRLPFHFLSLLVEARVYVVDVFLVQAVLGEAQAFTEALEVYDLARTQEFDDITHVRIVGKAQDIVVRHARFLLWGDLVSTTYTKI
mgnify:FL=1